MSFSPSERDMDVVETVERFGQARSDQIIRLHFQDLTSNGQRVVANRTLRRLCKWGYLVRIPQREIGSAGGGSTGFVYTVPRAKLQIDRHALAITEIYTLLRQNYTQDGQPYTLRSFNPESHAYQSICGVELQPDASVEIKTPSCPEGEHNWFFIELDRATESRPRIVEKLVRYSRAYDPEHKDFNGFPRILFVVDHPRGNQKALERAREIGRWIGQSTVQEAFVICTFDTAVDILTQ